MVPSGAIDAAGDAGFFRHLAHGGDLGGLALFDVALRQRPDQPAASVVPGDHGGAVPVHSRDGGVDDQTAGGGFLDAAQSGQRAASGRHGSIVLGRCRA